MSRTNNNQKRNRKIGIRNLMRPAINEATVNLWPIFLHPNIVCVSLEKKNNKHPNKNTQSNKNLKVSNKFRVKKVFSLLTCIWTLVPNWWVHPILNGNTNQHKQPTTQIISPCGRAHVATVVGRVKGRKTTKQLRALVCSMRALVRT